MPRLTSYDFGICSEPLLGRTLGDHFLDIASVDERHQAVVDCRQNIAYTYGELRDQVSLLARAFLKLGIQRGERIGIWSTSNVQWIITFLAAAEVGAILVNINPAYRLHELQYALNNSGTKVLVVIPSFKTSDYISMVREVLLPAGNSGKSSVPMLERVVVINGADDSEFLSFDRFLAGGADVPLQALSERMAEVQFDEPVNIQYTSGTTGSPKGVTLSHHNLLNNGVMAARAMELNANARFCIPMPFYHCGGMISSMLATLSVGGTVVIPGPFFDELEVLQAVQKHKCTHVSGVPTMFVAQLEHPDFKKYDTSSLQGGFMAGAPCPVQLMRRVASELHATDVIILYGLTEVSPLMTATNVKDSLEVRATTVGRAIPGIEVKVIDPVTGAILPCGVQGEICSRGHGVMLGYWNNPSATAETIDVAGWLHSGDLGVMHETGLVNITGRKKDMIIRGGENIYPREVEEVLAEHPAIAQAQVFGIPDAVNGEEVAAWIMLKAGVGAEPKQISEWLKERISYFKVPSHIKIVQEFPMTVTGKIQKFVMRDMTVKELGLQAANQIQTA